MLDQAAVPYDEARLDYAMFFVESLRRISYHALNPNHSNYLTAILKSGLEENCIGPEAEVELAKAKSLLPISNLKPWLTFLPEASRSYLES